MLTLLLLRLPYSPLLIITPSTVATHTYALLKSESAIVEIMWVADQRLKISAPTCKEIMLLIDV